MLPIGDENPTRTFPFVNYLLIAANVLCFAWEYLLIASGGEAWVVPGYGLVPARFVADPAGEAFTLITSMFMHGGLVHLGGNLLFLYIFGDNVEDAMGHLRYFGYYLLCGMAAALAQIAIGPTSTVPMVGASGAIAGALGGYLVLHPRAPITVLNSLPITWLFTGIFFVVPAWLMIGLWFVYNVVSGAAQLGMGHGGGVAFFAHVGGFLAGMLTVRAAISGRPRVDHGRWSGWRVPPRYPAGFSPRSPRPW